MGAFLQSSRQCFASYRGKLMGEVTRLLPLNANGFTDSSDQGKQRPESICEANTSLPWDQLHPTRP
jgi:hypothetical protein